MKIATLLTQLHGNESDLTGELLELSGRHPGVHEVHHVARDLSRWSAEHVALLAELAREHGEELETRTPAAEEPPAPQSTGFQLLSDLRSVYMNAAGISVQWVMLGQAAQALQLTDVLAAIDRCHPGTLRQMRWAATSLKQQSTQILVS